MQYYAPHSNTTLGSAAVGVTAYRWYNNLGINRSDYLQNSGELRSGNNLNLSSSVGFQITDSPTGVSISFAPGASFQQVQCQLMTAAFLGPIGRSQMYFEATDGTRLAVNTDYFGNARNNTRPTVGPFENLQSGTNTFVLFPQQSGPTMIGGRHDGRSSLLSPAIVSAAHGRITVRLTQPAVSASVTVHDAEGRMVATQKVVSGRTADILNGAPAGVYVVDVIADCSVVGYSKVLLTP